MPYRPQKRRASRTGRRNRDWAPSSGFFRCASGTQRSQRNRRNGSIGSATRSSCSAHPHGLRRDRRVRRAITAGGAAAVTLTQLEQGLPDPRSFQDLDFNEQSDMYSRDGETAGGVLGRPSRRRRRSTSIPKLVLDATTATEDDTFWDNPGVDLEATMTQLITGRRRWRPRWWLDHHPAARTRALLPEDVLESQFNSDEALYTRKAKEIMQAYKPDPGVPRRGQARKRSSPPTSTRSPTAAPSMASLRPLTCTWARSSAS